MKNNKKILIIEDEEPYQRILKQKLEEESFEVTKAKNGEEGLGLAIKNHPDLIVLDLLMPVMSGKTMLEKLQEDEWGKGAKVVVLSSMPDTGKIPIADYERDGIIEYFNKTEIKIDDLVRRIKTLLNG